MIRFKNLKTTPETYEIPISAGFGSNKQTVQSVKRTLRVLTPRDGMTNDPRAGSADLVVTPVTTKKQLPLTITLMAKGTKGDTSDPVDKKLARIEPFKSRIAARQLEVIPVPDEVEPEEPQVEAESATETPSATPAKSNPSPAPVPAATPVVASAIAPSAPLLPAVSASAPTADTPDTTAQKRGNKRGE